jgi:hypothetical protein
VVIADMVVNETSQILLFNVILLDKLRPQFRQVYQVMKETWEKKVLMGRKMTNDIRIVQHLSAACRTARAPLVSALPASMLLRMLDDNDVAVCRERRVDGVWNVGLLASMLLFIPNQLYWCYDIVRQTILDLTIPVMWCCFVLLNYALSLISPYVLVAIYIFAAIAFMVIFCVARTQWYRDSIARYSSISGERESVFEYPSTTKQNTWTAMNSLDGIESFDADQLKFSDLGNMGNAPADFDGVSPMFTTARNSSMFRRIRSRTDVLNSKLPASHRDDSRVLGASDVSRVISVANVREMFLRAAGEDGFLEGASLAVLCERVLRSVNVHVAGVAVSAGEMDGALDIVPRFSSKKDSDLTDSRLNVDDFMQWLDASLEHIDVVRHSDKIMLDRLIKENDADDDDPETIVVSVEGGEDPLTGVEIDADRDTAVSALTRVTGIEESLSMYQDEYGVVSQTEDDCAQL